MAPKKNQPAAETASAATDTKPLVSPFPAFARPAPAECRAALAALEAMHPAGVAIADGCDAEAAVASVMDSLGERGDV